MAQYTFGACSIAKSSSAFPSGAGEVFCLPFWCARVMSANERTVLRSSCRPLMWPKKAQRRQLRGSFGSIREEFVSVVPRRRSYFN